MLPKGQTMYPSLRRTVCATCYAAISQRKVRPAEALSNDMVFYAPRETFEHEATFMELLCASPRLTSMICFSLEKKLRSQRALDEDALMSRHRLAARGNARPFLCHGSSCSFCKRQKQEAKLQGQLCRG